MHFRSELPLRDRGIYALHRLSLKMLGVGLPGERIRVGEIALLQQLTASLPGTHRIFDVGANVGNYARLVINALGPQTNLTCFEPSNVAFGQLSRFLQEYPSAEGVQAAVGASHGTAALYSDVPGSSHSSLLRRGVFSRKELAAEMVEVITIDSFCEQRGIEHIDLLKVDVEGSELAVLAGAKQLLESRGIAYLQFEMGGTWVDARSYLRDCFEVLPSTYHLYRAAGRRWIPLTRHRHRDEIFLMQNLVAVRSDLRS